MGQITRFCPIFLSNHTTFLYKRNSIFLGKDAKLPSALDFYSPRPRTPVIYSEYGKTLFQELKQIRDMAKKSIQNAQKSQKKQYDKRSHSVTIKAGDTVFVKSATKI